jgi:protoheme IX farnesyltransferase
MLTAVGGAYLAGVQSMNFNAMVLFHVFIGTMLVGGGAGALNQYLERAYDAMMKRTENRPLPSGRLSELEVLRFGGGLCVLGIGYLGALTNLLTSFLALLTLVSYLALYTPLKRVTWYSTVVGGLPGALPPVMGWVAHRNEITFEALILFVILFCWQMPHFFSLAWMYRKDYERAGFPMLPVVDREGARTGTQILFYSAALVGTTTLLGIVGGLGAIYLGGSIALGLTFTFCGVTFRRNRSNANARRVFVASLAYLPALLAVVVLDRL